MPFVFVIVLAASAIAVAALGFVPTLLGHYGVELSGGIQSLFEYVDLAGEILLGLFALILVLRARDRDK